LKAGSAVPVTSVGGIVWPALPHAAAQTMLAAQFQLDRSQWWAPELLRQRQLDQLRALFGFALAQAPYYRTLAGRHHPALPRNLQELTWESFAQWPLLRKADLHEHGAALLAAGLPPDHGGSSWQITSGSTGEPVRCAVSTVAQFFRSALHMRNLLWHEFDFSLTYANIRHGLKQAERAGGWGLAPNVAFETGPGISLPASTDIEAQLDWLIAEAPGYVHAPASNLRALLLQSRAAGRRPARIDALLSYAESVPADLRALAREVWDTRLIDTYSCTEAGILALQCPSHDHYHQQAETAIVEVLRADGSPCAPGETGRVVVTDLVNFAMPLIRYELGDYAQVGEACGCGRGLPVLTRVAGRERNMAVDPTGRRFWPSFPEETWFDAAPLRGLRMVQHTPLEIEICYVMERELDGAERARLTAAFRDNLAYPFEFRYTRVASIARAPGEKFEEFVSLCAP